jgi:hypothetical protein
MSGWQPPRLFYRVVLPVTFHRAKETTGGKSFNLGNARIQRHRASLSLLSVSASWNRHLLRLVLSPSLSTGQSDDARRQSECHSPDPPTIPTLPVLTRSPLGATGWFSMIAPAVRANEFSTPNPTIRQQSSRRRNLLPRQPTLPDPRRGPNPDLHPLVSQSGRCLQPRVRIRLYEPLVGEGWSHRRDLAASAEAPCRPAALRPI